MTPDLAFWAVVAVTLVLLLTAATGIGWIADRAETWLNRRRRP